MKILANQVMMIPVPLRHNLFLLRKHLLPLLCSGRRARQAVAAFRLYAQDWRNYAALPAAESLRVEDAYPCLYDRTPAHPFDAHYFYQDIWAFKAILAAGAEEHVDVGSRAILVGMLTAITRTIFVDIRPLDVTLENYESRPGSVLALPFADNSVKSLSCLHVAEHIGLGRYGDPLDPLGTQKATAELGRVLASGGNLYFSLPVGKPKVCFNAHRIHTPQQIVDYFAGLTLLDFSAVDDGGVFQQGIAPGQHRERRHLWRQPARMRAFPGGNA